MGATAMQSTDWFGIGKIFESFDRPSVNLTRKTYKYKKGKVSTETDLSFNISKFDAIVGLIVVSALYIAIKRHMQGQSASEGFYGSMLTQNPILGVALGQQTGTGIGGIGTGENITRSMFSGLPGDLALISAPYRWYTAAQMLAGQ